MTSLPFSDKSDEFILDRKNWTSLPKNRHRIVRNIYVVVLSKSPKTFTGPAVYTMKLPVGSDVKAEKTQVKVVKNTIAVTTSLQETFSAKFATEFATALKSEVSLSPPSGKQGVEINSKFTTEFTETLVKETSRTKTYEISTSTELLNSVSYKTPAKNEDLITYYFYLNHWEWAYDIYLYRKEIFELTYRKKWIVFKNRTDFGEDKFELKAPLARLTFYEPQNEFLSVGLDPFVPDIQISEGIRVSPLALPFPDLVVTEKFTPILDLAKIAFPENRDEKKASDKIQEALPKPKSSTDELVDRIVRVYGTPSNGGPRKKSGKKGSAKRIFAKKAAKKSLGGSRIKSSRKTARKKSAKKTARKSAKKMSRRR